MFSDDYLDALEKLSRRASMDDTFARALRRCPAAALREYATSLGLTEAESLELRRRPADRWGPEALACTAVGQSSLKGAYGEAIGILATTIDKDPALAFEFGANASRAIRDAWRFRLRAKHVTELRRRTVEDWRAQVDVFAAREDGPRGVFRLTPHDVVFMSCERIEQLIGDVDVLKRVGPFVPLNPKKPGGHGRYLPDAANHTLSRTQTKYLVEGCGLGNSFLGIVNDAPAVIFLFGDTINFNAHDPIGYTSSSAAEVARGQLKLKFFEGPNQFYGPMDYYGSSGPTQPPNHDGWYTQLAVPSPPASPSSLPVVWLSDTSTGHQLTNYSIEGTKAWNIPYSGFTVGQGQMYIVQFLGGVSSGHGTGDHTNSYSLLTTFVPSTTSAPNTYCDPPSARMVINVGTAGAPEWAQIPISSVPQGANGGGKFVRTQFYAITVPDSPRGQYMGTPGTTWILMWGTGYNTIVDGEPLLREKVYLAMTRPEDFVNIGISGESTWYYAGADKSGKNKWSTFERNAHEVTFENEPASVQDFSVGCVDLQWSSSKNLGGGVTVTTHCVSPIPELWILLSNTNPPGVSELSAVNAYFSISPWGPWIGPLETFSTSEGWKSSKSQGFIHEFSSDPMDDDGLNGPYLGKPRKTPRPGHVFAPMIIAEYTKLEPTAGYGAPGATLTIFFSMSTWVPYYVVLMKAQFGLPFVTLSQTVTKQHHYPPTPPGGES